MNKKNLFFGLITVLFFAAVFNFSVNSDNAHAAYNTLPTEVPEDPHQYINLTTSSEIEGYPEVSFVKVYGASNNAKAAQIYLVDRSVGATQACHGFLIDVAIQGAGSFQHVATIDPTPRSGENKDCNNPRPFTIPASSLKGPSTSPGKKGLYEGILRFSIKNASDEYKTPAFTVIMTGGSGRLGYAQETKTTIYPSALGSTSQGSNCCGTGANDTKAVHTIQSFFKPPCDYDFKGSKRVRFGWLDFDRSIKQQPQGTPTVKVLEYDEKGKYTGDANAGNLIYSDTINIGGLNSGDPGGISLDVKANHKYEVRISSVRGGNGIVLIYPFDSGNFDFECPIPPPPKEDLVWYLQPHAEGKAQAGAYYPQSGLDKDGKPIDYHDANVSSALSAFSQARIALSVQETKKEKDVKSGEHYWNVEYYFARTEGGQSAHRVKNTNYTGDVPKDQSYTFTENSQVPTGSGSGIDYLTGNGRDPGTSDQYCERLVRNFTPTNGNGADPASPYTCVQLNGPCISVPWTATGSSRIEGDPSNGGTPDNAWVRDRYTFYYNFYNQGPASNTRPISFIHNGSYDSSRTLGQYSPNYNRTIVATDGGSTITDSMSFSPTQEDKRCNTSGNQSYSNKIVVPYYFHITPAISSEPRVQQGDIITPASSITLPIQNSDGTRYHTWSHDTITQLAEVINPKPADAVSLASKFPDPSDSEADPCAYVDSKVSSDKCSVVSSQNSGHVLPSNAPQPVNSFTKSGDATVKLPVGTKVCYIVGITRPVEEDDNPAPDSPKWRYSKMTCTAIVKKPKVQFQNSDVTVGRTFSGVGGTTASGCAAPLINATIETAGAPNYVSTHYKDPILYGSWVEYGAFATGQILQFGTANIPTGLSNPSYTDTTKLAFSNTGGNTGGFDYGSAQCLTNVFALDKDSSPAPSGAIDLKSLKPNGKNKADYASDSKITIGNGSGIPSDGRDIIIHARGACSAGATDPSSGSGNVEITKDINYGGPFPNAINIPRVIILADCNIVVDKGVGRVDAWLIAKGSLITCNKSLPSDGSALNLTIKDCDTHVKFNGPVAANRFRLIRTGGSDLTKPDKDVAAEIFDYRPDQMISSYLRHRNQGGVRAIYQVDLPPRY